MNIQGFLQQVIAGPRFNTREVSENPAASEKMFPRFLEAATGRAIQRPFGRMGQGSKEGCRMMSEGAKRSWACASRFGQLGTSSLGDAFPLGNPFVSRGRTEGLERFLAEKGLSHESIKEFLSGLFEEKGRKRVAVPELLANLLSIRGASGRPVFDPNGEGSLVSSLQELFESLDLGNQGVTDETDPVRSGRMETGEITSSFQLGRWISDRIGGEMEGAARPENEEDWVQALRDRLLAGGKPLEELALSPEGLPALKALLLSHGISQEDIERAFNGVHGAGSGEAIGIPEVLSRIMNLADLDRESDENLVMTPAVIPQVESLLRDFGLNAAQTRDVIVRSKVEGGALGVRRLQDNLRGIASKISVESQSVVQEENANLEKILGRLGIPDESGAMPKGPVSLEGFIKILDEKVARSSHFRLAQGEGEAQTKRLLDHIVVADKKQDVHQGKGFQDQYPQALNGFGKKGIGQPERRLSSQEGIARKQESLLTGETKATAGDQRGQGLPPTDGEDGSQPFNNLAEARMKSLSPGRETGGAARHSEKACLEVTDPGAKIPGRAVTPIATGKPNAPSIPLHVVNQVGQRLTYALRRGENRLRIQLKPPELGSIQLEMTMKDNVLKVAMVAEHHAVKEALMSHVSELKQTLMQQGIDLQKVDVAIEYDFGQSMANARKHLGGDRFNKGGTPLGRGSEVAGEGTEDLQPVRTGGMDAYSRLDLFA